MLTNLSNTKLPPIPNPDQFPKVQYIVFYRKMEKKIMSYQDLDYGIISNISPGWWVNLVLYENTNKIEFLEKAKKYAQGSNLTVFFPELLLNLNQQRNIESILDKLELPIETKILIKTDSPFIIQACGTGGHKLCYLGTYE